MLNHIWNLKYFSLDSVAAKVFQSCLFINLYRFKIPRRYCFLLRALELMHSKYY